MRRRWLVVAFAVGCVAALALVFWRRGNEGDPVALPPVADRAGAVGGVSPEPLSPLPLAAPESEAEGSATNTDPSMPCRLTVSVVDEAGKAVPGGYLVVGTVAEPPPGQKIVGNEKRVEQGRCDGAGRFVCDLPGPGRYRVHVTARNSLIGKEDVPGSGYYAERSDGGAEFDVPSGTASWTEQITIEARMGDRIEGIVVDGNGRPVAEARILGERDERSQRDVESDSEGHFLIYGLLRGETVTLRAQKMGEGISTRREVGAGTSGVIIELQSPASVSGRVLDSDGVPVAGAAVGWTSRSRFDPQEEAQFEAKATTDEQGRYRIEGIIFVEGHVMARMAGYALGHESITVELGRLVDGVDLVLERGASVYGVVTNGDGAPVAGARVGLVNWGAGLRLDASAETDREGRYALANLAFGRYDVGVAYEGAIRETRRVHVPSAGDREENWVVGDGGVIEGRLLRNGRPAEGFVQVTTYPVTMPFGFDFHSDLRLNDFSSPASDGRTIVRAEQGRFRVAGLAARTYYLVGLASAPGEMTINEDVSMGGQIITTEEGGTLLIGAGNALTEIRNGDGALPSATVTLHSAETTHVDLDFGGGGVVEGVVTCDGVGVEADLELWVFDGGTRRSYSTESDGSGAYRFAHVDAGQGVLSVRTRVLCGKAESHRHAGKGYRTEFVLDGQGVAQVDVELTHTGIVKGTVPDSITTNGHVYLLRDGVRTDRVLDDEAPGVAGETRPRDGAVGFVFAPVEPGMYWVYGTDEQRNIVTEAASVAVRAGETAEVVLSPKG